MRDIQVECSIVNTKAIRTFWAVLDLFVNWQVMFPESRFAQFRKPVRLRLTKLASLGAARYVH
jgi:hypothetical protein